MSKDMEHLEMKWVIGKQGLDSIITIDESEPWYVADARTGLPQDKSGRKTLQYICNLHNAELARKRRKA